MTAAKRISRILGPALIVLGVTEAINLPVFAGNPAPLVYLNGTLLFVAGVAIVQAHGRWTSDWRTLVTLSGWVLILGGLYRMVAPGAPQASEGVAVNVVFTALVTAGAVLTYKGYARERPG